MSVRKPTEQDLVRQVVAYLALRRVLHWRQNQGGMRYARPAGGAGFVKFTSIDGISDVLAVLPGGRLAAIECKTPAGQLRPAQRAFLDAVAAAGGAALVVRSLPELQAALDPLLGVS